MQEPIRLGDPHLGKVFRNGVPLNRKGDREKSQWQDFEASIRSSNGLHICVGDLFDEFHVPYDVVLKAALIYKSEARKHPSNTYIVMRGNHDASRIAGEISAYAVFAELLRDIPNVVVLEDAPHIEGKRLFVPWHPFSSAIEMLTPYSNKSFDEVYGHWDVRDFGNSNPNLLPVERLRNMCPLVFTGHEHKPQASTYSGFKLIQTGSMQPYAHGQDDPLNPNPKYRTFTLPEFEALSESTHDLCLRIRLRPGEVPPENIDCLQLTLESLRMDAQGEEIAEVKMEDFDLKTLFEEACDEHDVAEPTREKVWQDFRTEH